jgi:hypothetical protein
MALLGRQSRRRRWWPDVDSLSPGRGLPNRSRARRGRTRKGWILWIVSKSSCWRGRSLTSPRVLFQNCPPCFLECWIPEADCDRGGRRSNRALHLYIFRCCIDIVRRLKRGSSVTATPDNGVVPSELLTDFRSDIIIAKFQVDMAGQSIPPVGIVAYAKPVEIVQSSGEAVPGITSTPCLHDFETSERPHWCLKSCCRSRRDMTLLCELDVRAPQAPSSLQ